jgi:hypothetical protein
VGMPLPDAWGENRLTSQAAIAAAAAQTMLTTNNPAKGFECDQTMMTLRSLSAHSSESRKSTPTKPEARPTMSAKMASTRRLTCLPS